MRFFNLGGPCEPDYHYMLPPEPRLPQARLLIERHQYFVVHGPRQSGKTTTLAAIARSLRREGRYAALRISCEAGERFTNIKATEHLLLGMLRGAALGLFPPEWLPPPWPASQEGITLRDGLRAWAGHCPVPLVLMLDDFDALRGDGVLSVLRQLRDGYTEKDLPFPHSVVLCGLRDVRDYRVETSVSTGRVGSPSPFNIVAETIRLAEFTPEQVRELYGQYTAESGQPFTDAAVDAVQAATGGQPWLVNALAQRIVDELCVPLPEPITADHVEWATQRIWCGPGPG